MIWKIINLHNEEYIDYDLNGQKFDMFLFMCMLNLITATSFALEITKEKSFYWLSFIHLCYWTKHSKTKSDPWKVSLPKRLAKIINGFYASLHHSTIINGLLVCIKNFLLNFCLNILSNLVDGRPFLWAQDLLLVTTSNLWLLNRRFYL